jgi:hypothetical protein
VLAFDGYSLINMFKVYNIFCTFLISKSWEMEQLEELLSVYDDILAAPKVKDILKLLENFIYEPAKYAKIAQDVKHSKIVIREALEDRVIFKAMGESMERVSLHNKDDLNTSLDKREQMEKLKTDFAGLFKVVSKPRVTQ